VDLSKLSSKGQVTIPAEIRKKLNLKEGDKVLFVEENGRVFISNASLVAFHQLQQAMEGEAARAGVATEAEVVALVKEIRNEAREKRLAGHD
jgi:antitoxin PrlF